MTVPEAQGRGTGTWLIGESVRRLDSAGIKELHLYVTRGNRAERLYRRLGFTDLPS